MDALDPWDLLIYAGSAGFILCLMPQLIKTLQTRRADDLAWGFLVLVLLSSGCALPYFLHQGEYVFAVAQAVNLGVWGTVLAVKMYPRPRRLEK